jgi:gas vesicle protein
MNTQPQEQQRGGGFTLGLLTGAMVGAGLALWFMPLAGSELRRQVRDTSKGLVGKGRDLLDKGRDLRDDAATAVARGAHEVERYAKSVKS